MWKVVGRELLGTARDSWEKYVWEDMREGEELGVYVKQRERERWRRRGRILLFGSRWKPLKDFELRSDTRSDWGLNRITIVCCTERRVD